MKMMLNGAVTIGTLDGANVEMLDEVGKENIFIFGLRAEEVEHRRGSYNPWEVYNSDEEIRQALTLIEKDFFSLLEPGIFKPLLQSLLDGGDHYMLLADLRDYIQTQERVDAAYRETRSLGPNGNSQRGPRRKVLVGPRHQGVRIRDLALGTVRWREVGNAGLKVRKEIE